MKESGSQNDQNVVEHRGPYTVTERTVVHDKFHMQLIGDKVVRPDGSAGEQYWVNFPREAVLVYPIDDKDNIYLIEEFTYGTNRYSLEAAGGVIGENETPEEAAIRKVREELGVEIKPDSLRKLGEYGEITSKVNNISHSYLARVESVGEPNSQTADDITRQIMSFEKAMELVRSGTIYTGAIAAALWAINDILKNEEGFNSSQEAPKL